MLKVYDSIKSVRELITTALIYENCTNNLVSIDVYYSPESLVKRINYELREDGDWDVIEHYSIESYNVDIVNGIDEVIHRIMDDLENRDVSVDMFFFK